MPAQATDVEIRELSADQFLLILPLIERHNATIPAEELRRRLTVMVPHGYHCIAAFMEDRVVGVAGYWLGARFYCGEYMDVDNVVVDPDLRSRRIGEKMMVWLEAKARELGCKSVMLDSYVTFAGAHRFYFRLGYEILGYHFTKRL
jgi:GNAT superfamily N-acetyltransferase